MEPNNPASSSLPENKIEIVYSSRGGRMVLLDGYIFCKKRALSHEVSMFECKLRKMYHCRKTIKLRGDELMSESGCHNHESDLAAYQMAKLRKHYILNTIDSSSPTMQPQAQDDYSSVANSEYVRKLKLAHKKKSKGVHSCIHPTGLIDDVPADHCVLEGNQPFLLYDGGVNLKGYRVIIFGTKFNEQLLEKADHWFIDTTLLPDSKKNEAVYSDMIGKVHELVGREPKSLMIDFDEEMLRAARGTFSDCRIQGYFFHLSQSIFREVKLRGLLARYVDDTEFKHSVRMVAALAFIDKEDIHQAIDELKATLPSDVLPFLEFFEETYMKDSYFVNGVESAFNIDFWCMKDRVANDLPFSNGAIIAWQRKIQGEVGSYLVTICKFLETVKQDCIKYRKAFERGGDYPVSKWVSFTHIDYGIVKSCVATYDSTQLLDYLKEFALNITIGA